MSAHSSVTWFLIEDPNFEPMSAEIQALDVGDLFLHGNCCCLFSGRMHSQARCIDLRSAELFLLDATTLVTPVDATIYLKHKIRKS